MTAHTLTTPTIGQDIGSTTDQKSRNGRAPSTRAASKTSWGRLSKNRYLSVERKSSRLVISAGAMSV